MTRCVYPGSFDPITSGHLDIITRAARLYDRVYVALLHNVNKRSRLPLDERMAYIQRATAHLPQVVVESFDGLLVNYAMSREASAVIRGLRAVTDFENEFQMAQLNRHLCGDIETLFMMTSPEHAYVSSSAVCEIAGMGGNIAGLVPDVLLEDLTRALRH